MRSATLFAALAAAAGSLAQSIEWDIVDSAPPPPTSAPAPGVTAQSVTYNQAAATQSVAAAISADPLPQDPQPTVSIPVQALSKRGNCAVQPVGAGPVPTPDTASAFLAYPSFAASASAAPTPSGYYNSFTNLQASNNAYGYMGFTTLKTYDTELCASKCNAITGCSAFNIYFERDPTLDPGTGCENPPSTTNIKCVFWGGPVTQDNAKNAGQWRTNFQVVIAGSNGYIAKSIAPINGYTGPTYLGNAAINAPLDCAGGDTFLGSQMFTSGPFDASLCATACQAQSAYNIAHPPSNGAPQTCQFFNTYLLLKNGVSTGQVCALYSMAWDASKYGTNTGQYRGSDRYTIAYSYTFVDSTNPGKPMLPCDVASATSIIKTSSLQPFCSSLLGFTTPLTTVTIPTIVTVPSATVTETVTPVVTTTATTTSLVAVSQFAKRDVPTPTPCSHDHSVKRRDETCDSDIVKRGVLRRDTVTGSPATGTPPLSVAPSTIDTSAYVTLSALATGASGGYIEQPKFGILRRAVPSTPAALATLAPSAVTSGCALQATPVTLTSTISVATSITLSSGTITTQTTLPTTTSTTTQTVVSTTTIVIAQSAPTGAIGYLEVRPAVNGNSKYVLSDPSQHMTDNYYRSATERETFIVAADGSLYSVTHNAYYYVPSTSGPNLLYWSGNPTDASKIFSVGPAGADGSYKLKMAGFGNTYKLCLSKASSSDGNSFTGLHFYYFRTSDTFYSYCLPVDLYIVPV